MSVPSPTEVLKTQDQQFHQAVREFLQSFVPFGVFKWKLTLSFPIVSFVTDLRLCVIKVRLSEGAMAFNLTDE